MKDFSSKEKFYDDFNKYMVNTPVKVTLVNDSSFTALNGVSIANDSLFFTAQILKKEKIESNEIKNIKYLDPSSSNFAAIIILNNGKELKAIKADILSGSSINVLILEEENKNLPLRNIREASYNNHWLGVPVGLLSGTVLGYFTLGIVNTINPKKNNPGLLVFPAAAIIIGGVLGWNVGYNYIYRFNP